MPPHDCLPASQSPPLRLRVLQMALVWAFLGEWIGASIGMQSGGVPGAIAGTIVGMAEMAILGAVFGLLGGRVKETLIGAAFGLIAGLAIGGSDLLFRANFGLLIGAIEGATLRPYLRMATGILRLLSRPLVLLLGRVARLM